MASILHVLYTLECPVYSKIAFDCLTAFIPLVWFVKPINILFRPLIFEVIQKHLTVPKLHQLRVYSSLWVILVDIEGLLLPAQLSLQGNCS